MSTTHLTAHCWLPSRSLLARTPQTCSWRSGRRRYVRRRRRNTSCRCQFQASWTPMKSQRRCATEHHPNQTVQSSKQNNKRRFKPEQPIQTRGWSEVGISFLHTSVCIPHWVFVDQNNFNICTVNGYRITLWLFLVHVLYGDYCVWYLSKLFTQCLVYPRSPIHP